MLLRLLMVGAVASLGLDLPSGPDLDGWFGTTQAWLDQTWSCWSPPGDELACLDEEAAEAPAVAEPMDGPSDELVTAEMSAESPATNTTDQAFLDVVGEMAATFALPPEPPAVPPVPAEAPAVVSAPTWEPAEVGDDLYPGLAFELNRRNEGAPNFEQSPSPALAREAEAPEAPSTEDRPVSSRGERLAVAVRLTEQALHAWINLLRQGPSIISARE